MKTFASHMESLTQIRHSCCLRMLMATTFVLVFVTIGLPQTASAQETIIRHCPFPIEVPGKYSLGQDLNCDSSGISIVTSDVYLNLNGHTISGPGCGDIIIFGAVGINVGRANVHIVGGSDVRGKAGTVKGFDIGIQVDMPTLPVPIGHNHLSGLTLTENNIGISLKFANDNHISDSNIVANRGGGMRLENTNHNVIDSNVINRNGFGPDVIGFCPAVTDGGITIYINSDDNTITSNEFSRNNWGVRVGVGGDSNHNTIRGNTLKDNNTGIWVNNGSTNTIQDNTLIENDIGIELGDGSRNTFVYGNTALLNQRFDLRDQNVDCNDNTWTHNNFLTSAPACIQ
jgi:parallel beta-helix repeat protein